MISLQLLFFFPSSLNFSQTLIGRIVRRKLAKAKASDTMRSINYYLTNNFIYIMYDYKVYEPPISRSFLIYFTRDKDFQERERRKKKNKKMTEKNSEAL